MFFFGDETYSDVLGFVLVGDFCFGFLGSLRGD